MRLSRRWLGWMMVSMLVAGRGASAGGPRYVTGYPYFNNQGNAVHWNTASLLYFTDPGGLSASVNHAAADALVQAAAGVWNIPQASITLGQGGALAEHVSGANVYLGPGGMVYPTDVASSNSGSIAIAVIYDTDGSVTDTLLGSGASGPASCRQNAVTETVDGFDPAGYITHAIVVLNGRCTGPAAAQQMQMQYQLERVFGRVLGLAWSQVNDNVLMGSPTPTYNQALHWPIMHPVDIICGAYAYQCLPNPFQLRPDDIAGMVGLYGVGDGTTEAGKQGSLIGAEAVTGSVTFPTGQGMAGVNVLARRETLAGNAEGWYESSALTGTYFRRSGTSPFVGSDSSLTGSEGTFDGSLVGRYTIGYVPVQSGQTAQNVQVSLEAVNPLYVGALSLGAYPLGVVAPSGSSTPQTVVGANTDGYIYENFAVSSAAAGCGTGQDGTASAPVAMPATGWWMGVICGYGHAAYTELAVRAGRTLTVEVTALDEQGYATTAKAMPVMGLFAPSDQGNALPSVALAGVAFDSEEVGTTAMRATVPQTTGQVSGLRLGIADQRGDGRPDYAYQSRVFYADTVLPAQVGAAGGTVTISGSGFRQGNVVLVNGVGATVTSATANTLVVTVPNAVAAHAVGGTAVDLEVSDLSSGADSVMTGALVYGVAPAMANGMKLVSAPGGSLYVGDVAGTAFAVEMVKPDGSTPVAGERVTFSAGSGAALFGSCGAASCSVVTGSDGVASTMVTPESAGAVTLMAVDGALQQAVTVQVMAQDGKMTVVSAPPGSVPVGVTGATPFSVQVVDQSGRNAGGRVITFRVAGGAALLSDCNQTVCAVPTDTSGSAGVYVTPTGAGAITLTAMDGDLEQSVSLTGTSNADVLRVLSMPSATGLVNQATSYFSVQLLHGDGVTPDGYEHVIFTAPAGVTLSGCAASVCDLTTNGSGVVQTTIVAATAGTYTVQAAFGAVTQAATVTFVANTLQLQVVSGPVGNQVVGQDTTVPFTVRLSYTSGSVVSGGFVVIQGPKDGVVLEACGGFSCGMVTDGNGLVSTGVRTLRTGPITLDAVMGSAVVTDEFTGVLPADVVTFVTLPAAGFLVGSPVTLGVQVLLADGVTPAVGRSVTFIVTNGNFVFTGCVTGGCVAVTDAFGRASLSGVATQAGAVAVQAAEGGGVAVATFTADRQPDGLRLVSSPASGGFAGVAEGTAFAVQVLAGDGTVAAGRSVTLSVTGGMAGLGACGGAASCSVISDANGLVSTAVTPLGVGVVSLAATDAAAKVTASFLVVARPDLLAMVAAPADGLVVGASGLFAVRLLQGDGMTPDAGQRVTLAVTGGSATLGACGGAVCVLVTDANGLVQSAVTPLGAGVIGLSATAPAEVGGAMVMSTFKAVAAADLFRVVTVPDAAIDVGAASSVPFAVRVTLADGVTPVMGVAVVFQSGPQVALGACGGGSCTVLTGPDGVAATGVSGVLVGAVKLVASAEGLSVSAGLVVIADQESLAAVGPVVYVAEGARVRASLGVTAVFDGAASAGIGVSWRSGPGLVVDGASSVTDGSGVAGMGAWIGPLVGAGSAEACAWSGVCAELGAVGVSADALQVAVVSGGVQAVSLAAMPQAIVAVVTDGIGNVVRGAGVQVFQTVTEVDVACPVQGRCPVGRVLGESETVLVSGADGTVSFVPLTVAGAAAETKVLMTVGTAGVASADVVVR